MVSNISIVPALEADVLEMIALRVPAAEEDILTRFRYGHRHAEASQNEGAPLLDRLGKRFTRPTQRCHIAKTVDLDTNELVGWGLIRWEDDGQWVYTSMPPPLKDSDPVTVHAIWTRGVISNWQKILAGKPHLMIGALNVRVDRQRQGIGKKIIQYFDTEYGVENELVVVQTKTSAEEFYRKLGWETVDSTDIDLSKFAGEGMGFGIHRSPQMVRYPKS